MKNVLPCLEKKPTTLPWSHFIISLRIEFLQLPLNCSYNSNRTSANVTRNVVANEASEFIHGDKTWPLLSKGWIQGAKTSVICFHMSSIARKKIHEITNNISIFLQFKRSFPLTFAKMWSYRHHFKLYLPWLGWRSPALTALATLQTSCLVIKPKNLLMYVTYKLHPGYKPKLAMSLLDTLIWKK